MCLGRGEENGSLGMIGGGRDDGPSAMYLPVDFPKVVVERNSPAIHTGTSGKRDDEETERLQYTMAAACCQLLPMTWTAASPDAGDRSRRAQGGGPGDSLLDSWSWR